MKNIEVGFALAVCQKLEIFDSKKQKFVFRFVKMYPEEKILKILERARLYYWWRNNPSAAFMKAVGEINKEEKNGRSTN